MLNDISLELGNFIRVKLGSTLLYKRNKKTKKVAFSPFPPLRMDGNYVKKRNERKRTPKNNAREWT